MSKVFELHFNPSQKKRQAVFDTFCFSPETRQERGLGSLYLLGEIKNGLSETKKLLTTLAEVIKNSYYETSSTVPAEDRLKMALQKANEFLASHPEESHPLDLNFAVLSLTPDLSLNLSKTGDIKILVFTQGDAFDIGGGINVSSAAKEFPNLIGGKLAKRDKILLLTKEVFESFNNEGILEGLAHTKKPKEAKRILKANKDTLRELFGAGLLVFAKRRRIHPNLPRVQTRSMKKTRSAKGILTIAILAILLLLGYLIF